MTDKEPQIVQEGRNPSLKEIRATKWVSGFHTDGKNLPLAQAKISRPTPPPAPPKPSQDKK
jgi:hypothetical protein